jgi:hypothetical protein
MPLVAKKGEPNKIDFAIVQRAWWDAILKVYEPKHQENCPMRMPLEMRIMGGSNIIMAPQRHNALGTCSIEALMLHSASDIWLPFAQEVINTWMSYTDPNTGKKLNTRPHWAKEWYEGMASDAVEVETRDIQRGTYWVRVYRRTHRERGKLYPGFI